MVMLPWLCFTIGACEMGLLLHSSCETPFFTKTFVETFMPCVCCCHCRSNQTCTSECTRSAKMSAWRSTEPTLGATGAACKGAYKDFPAWLHLYGVPCMFVSCECMQACNFTCV
jgi:hypothetical protein